MTSFSQALQRGSTTNDVFGMSTVVDPRTGEMLDLAKLPHEQLIDVFLVLQERERQEKQWRTAVEDELVRRHGDRRAAQVVGDHEVDVDRGFTRKWDVDELAGVMQYLEDEGLLKRAECAGLIRRVEELKVDGRKAAQLLNRVEGDALAELRRCFTWEQKGRAKVKVTPVAQLEQ